MTRPLKQTHRLFYHKNHTFNYCRIFHSLYINVTRLCCFFGNGELMQRDPTKPLEQPCWFLLQLYRSGHITYSRTVIEPWSSHSNVESWAPTERFEAQLFLSSDHYNLVITVRELLLWGQLQERKWCELSLSDNITSYRERQRKRARQTIVTALRGPDGCEI